MKRNMTCNQKKPGSNVRTLHQEIASKLLLIGLRRGCLKTIIFAAPLIFRSSHHAGFLTFTNELNGNTPKKDSVEGASGGQPDPEGFSSSS